MITIDFNFLRFTNSSKILDVGCGTGRHMAAICDIGNFNVFGTDLSFECLRLAKKRMLFHKKLSWHDYDKWKLLIADIKSLPFKNNYFDIVVCSEVLEHIKDDLTAINELARVLKLHKTIVISVPRYLPEKICWILSKKYFSTPGGHLRIYRKNELIKLCKKFGLYCIDYHYSHSLHTPYWWLKCIMDFDSRGSFVLDSYHSFLTWTFTKKNKKVSLIDKLLNPIIGKSLVLYLKKVHS